jgi:hypothetical protein
VRRFSKARVLCCVAVGSIMLLGVSAAPAHASTSTENVSAAAPAAVADVAPEARSFSACILAPYGNVCGYGGGSGLFVDYIKVTRNKASYEFICNWRARYLIRRSDGSVLRDVWSPTRAGCYALRVTQTWNTDYLAPNNARVCVSFFEGGRQQGGSVCWRVHI